MYFEASGEDGGEVKLMTKGQISGAMMSAAAEPGSACAGVVNTPGALLSLAGTQMEHQKKNIEALQVRTLIPIIDHVYNLNIALCRLTRKK